MQFIQNCGTNICKQDNSLDFVPLKFLILTLSLVMELQMLQERTTEYGVKFRTKSEKCLPERIDQLSYAETAGLYQKFTCVFISIMV